MSTIQQTDNWIDIGHSIKLRTVRDEAGFWICLRKYANGPEIWFSLQEWRGITEFAKSASVVKKREGVTDGSVR